MVFVRDLSGKQKKEKPYHRQTKAEKLIKKAKAQPWRNPDGSMKKTNLTLPPPFLFESFPTARGHKDVEAIATAAGNRIKNIIPQFNELQKDLNSRHHTDDLDQRLFDEQFLVRKGNQIYKLMKSPFGPSVWALDMFNPEESALVYDHILQSPNLYGNSRRL
jgi:hypothetical protein